MTELRTPKPIPAWLKLDTIVTQDDIDEVEAVRAELAALIPAAMKIGARKNAVLQMSDQWDCSFDDCGDVLNPILGIDVVNELTDLLTYLLCHPAGWPDGVHVEKVAAQHEATFPGLSDAVAAATEGTGLAKYEPGRTSARGD